MITVMTPSSAPWAQREALARHIPAMVHRQESLALLAGDFNFVVADNDRWSKVTSEFSGGDG